MKNWFFIKLGYLSVLVGLAALSYYMPFSHPTLILPILDYLSVSTLDSIPVNTITSLIGVVFIFFLYKVQSLKSKGQYISNFQRLVSYSVLLSLFISIWLNAAIIGYNLQLTDAKLTAIELAKFGQDGIAQINDHAISKDRLIRLQELIKARTGNDLNFEKPHEAFTVISEFIFYD